MGWKKVINGRPWFQNDGGCYIHWHWIRKTWLLCSPRGKFFNLRYEAKSSAYLPPATGWEYSTCRPCNSTGVRHSPMIGDCECSDCGGTGHGPNVDGPAPTLHINTSELIPL